MNDAMTDTGIPDMTDIDHLAGTVIDTYLSDTTADTLAATATDTNWTDTRMSETDTYLC